MPAIEINGPERINIEMTTLRRIGTVEAAIIYAYLCATANKTTATQYSSRKIAGETTMTSPTVMRALRMLAEKQLITMTVVKGGSLPISIKLI